MGQAVLDPGYERKQTYIQALVLCRLPQESIDPHPTPLSPPPHPEGSTLIRFTPESRKWANPAVVVLLTAARRVWFAGPPRACCSAGESGILFLLPCT